MRKVDVMRAQPKASHFVGGSYVEDTAGREIVVAHPATGETIAVVHSASPAIIEAAATSAKAAQREWVRLKPVDRARIMRRAEAEIRERNDEIALLESLDTGRAISETLYVDAVSVADVFEFFAGVVPAWNGEAINLGDSWSYTRREPFGVCFGIGAWNYPFQLAGWKSAPALAAGNSMVFKPSETAPLSALLLAEILANAGVPAGLLNVIQGYGDVGEAMIRHPLVSKISFTGSPSTGRKVYGLAGSLMKPATMELGGKSPLIVFDDAPLENAVNGAMMANYYSTGQICTNGTRVFVQRDLVDPFVKGVLDKLQDIRIGDPLDPSTNMGPMATAAQRDMVLDYIESGKAEGATLMHGGGIPKLQGMENGFWIEPALFTDVTDGMRIAKEEIFGPVMSVFAFDDEDEVIERANSTDLGLAAAVFTRDIARAHRVIGQIEAGTCWINNYNLTPVELPFGGYKGSGVGRECSIAALDHYSQIKSVYVEAGDVETVF